MELAFTLLILGLFVWVYFSRLKFKEAALKLQKELSSLRSEIERDRENEIKRLKYVEERKIRDKENDLNDIDNQIRFIEDVNLYLRKPVNKEASKIIYIIEDWMKANNPNWRLSFEVSMGSFIRTSFIENDKKKEDSREEKAFKSYNSKRVDFLIIDQMGLPKAVIEYNGSGHNGSSSDAANKALGRMQVKRLVLEKVSIPLIEVAMDMQKSEIHQMISDSLTLKDKRPSALQREQAD